MKYLMNFWVFFLSYSKFDEIMEKIATSLSDRMWTMLGSWTMSVTQLVEASCVSQKCTVGEILR